MRYFIGGKSTRALSASKANRWRIVGIILYLVLSHLIDWGPFDLLVNVYAQAATTVVTATVKDSNGTVYALGSYGVTLVNNSGQQATIGGNANFQTSYSGQTLTAAGVMSITLPSVTSFDQSGIQWQFSFCANPKQIAAIFPAPALPCFSYTSTGTQISGSSVDISSSLTPAVIPLPGGGGAPIADPAFVGAALPSVGGAPQIFQIGYFSTASSVSSIAATFPFATSQNHTYLVNFFQPSANTVTSVTTTQGDTCTQVGSTQTVGSKNNYVYVCSGVIGGASTTITANFSAVGTFDTISIVELAPSTVDISAAATGTSTAPSSGNFTTANTQDTLVGFVDFITLSACNATITTFNQCNLPASGYATIMGQDGQQGNTFIWLESQTVTGTGTFSASGTLKTSSTWAAFGIAMKGTPVTPVVSNSSGAGPFSLGTITSLLTPVQFKISGGQITAGQGQLNINVTSGSITNPAWVLEASVDGGTSWVSVPCQVRTVSNVVASEQIPIYSAMCSLQGLMGETGTNFRFGPYQGYGISSLTVWGSI